MKSLRIRRITALPAAVTVTLALLLVGAVQGVRGAPGTDSPAAQITRLLEDQATAWNRGDIEGFMAGYEPSETLRFASGGDVTRGWKSTLERYRSRYPDTATMGRLSFTELEVTPLGSDAAVVFGQWRLVRGADSPHGLFTLTLRKGGQGWRIIQDHTSSATP
jgi:ketosteroid isomerase-like protein